MLDKSQPPPFHGTLNTFREAMVTAITYGDKIVGRPDLLIMKKALETISWK